MRTAAVTPRVPDNHGVDRRTAEDEHERIECILIAGALQNVDVAHRLTRAVLPGMFFDPNRARCWAAIARVATNGTGPLAMPDAVALELHHDPTGLVALHDSARMMPEAKRMNVDYFGRLVTKASTRRIWRRRIRNGAIVV